MAVSDPLEAHYRTVVKGLLDGRVVPLLGAGVNLCGRPEDARFEIGKHLPNGPELAQYLAERFSYPADEDMSELVRVSQYASVLEGSGPLYEELHYVFDADYPPTPLHSFLAGLPRFFRARGLPPRYQLVVTTNYDDALECAFKAEDEPYDLVTYIAEGPSRGNFVHAPPGEPPRLIEKANQYTELPVDARGNPERTVILKIHGTVDREVPPDWDSFVITEDHYIEYLTRSDISAFMPATLAAKMKRSHFLFLGYSLRDWNLRVILHRIWGEQHLSYNSWAIQLRPQRLEQEFWDKRNVEIFDVALEHYVERLAARMQETQVAATQP
jgi:SIR2-like domain